MNVVEESLAKWICFAVARPRFRLYDRLWRTRFVRAQIDVTRSFRSAHNYSRRRRKGRKTGNKSIWAD